MATHLVVLSRLYPAAELEAAHSHYLMACSWSLVVAQVAARRNCRTFALAPGSFAAVELLVAGLAEAVLCNRCCQLAQLAGVSVPICLAGRNSRRPIARSRSGRCCSHNYTVGHDACRSPHVVDDVVVVVAVAVAGDVMPAVQTLGHNIAAVFAVRSCRIAVAVAVAGAGRPWRRYRIFSHGRIQS
jgi:hypothetical protein